MALSTIEDQLERFYIQDELLVVVCLCYSKEIPNEISMIIYEYAKTHILQKNLNKYLQICPNVVEYHYDNDMKELRSWQRGMNENAYDAYTFRNNKRNGSGKSRSLLKRDIQYNQIITTYNREYRKNVNRIQKDFRKQYYMDINTGRMYSKKGMEEKYDSICKKNDEGKINTKDIRIINQDIEKYIKDLVSTVGLDKEMEHSIACLQSQLVYQASSKNNSIEHKNTLDIEKIRKKTFKRLTTNYRGNYYNDKIEHIYHIFGEYRHKKIDGIYVDMRGTDKYSNILLDHLIKKIGC
tara:strand:+ start:147 stop:1031 length:885 start_codon:yes stop_codon:yes gene_type:complete